MIVEKQKDGPVGTVTLGWDAKSARFYNQGENPSQPSMLDGAGRKHTVGSREWVAGYAMRACGATGTVLSALSEGMVREGMAEERARDLGALVEFLRSRGFGVGPGDDPLVSEP